MQVRLSYVVNIEKQVVNIDKFWWGAFSKLVTILMLQKLGNLELKNSSHKPIWQSGIFGLAKNKIWFFQVFFLSLNINFGA